MNAVLDGILIGASLALAVVAGIWAARNRPVPGWQFALAALVELLILAVVVLAVVRMAQGARPSSVVLYVGYLVSLVVVLPFGAWCGRIERSRYGAVVLAVTALVTPVLVARLLQVWRAHHGA